MLLDNSFYEREVDYKNASQRWKKTIKKLNLEYRLKNLSKFGTCSHVCEIKNIQSNWNFQGYGKGTKNQSVIGAKYEALEHLTSIPAIFSKIDLYYFSVYDAFKNKLPILEYKIPIQLLTDENLHQSSLAWVKFESITQKNYYFAPAVSCHPFYIKYKDINDSFDYEKLYIHSSNNGCASGSTYNEALLHSILEIIERDAISFFLINTFIAPKKNFLKKIDIKKLSITLNKTIQLEKFLKESCCTIKAFEMPNEFEIPAYCAILYHPDFLIPVKGFGCSPLRERALERAVYEAIQVYNIYAINTIHEDRLTISALKDWPQLLNCVNFDLSKISQSQYRKTSYFVKKEDVYHKNIRYFLDKIIASISKKKFNILVNIRYQTDQFCSLQTLIPGCEEFYLIISGTIPRLGKRAKKLLYTDI